MSGHSNHVSPGEKALGPGGVQQKEPCDRTNLSLRNDEDYTRGFRAEIDLRHGLTCTGPARTLSRTRRTTRSASSSAPAWCAFRTRTPELDREKPGAAVSNTALAIVMSYSTTAPGCPTAQWSPT